MFTSLVKVGLIVGLMVGSLSAEDKFKWYKNIEFNDTKKNYKIGILNFKKTRGSEKYITLEAVNKKGGNPKNKEMQNFMKSFFMENLGLSRYSGVCKLDKYDKHAPYKYICEYEDTNYYFTFKTYEHQNAITFQISKKFTNKYFKDDKQIKKNGLALLQSIVGTKDRDTIYKLIFNNQKLLGNYIEVFKYNFAPNEWSQELGQYGVKYPIDLVTANSEQWAFPRSQTELNQYKLKGEKKYYISKEGLNHFVSDVKSTSVFKSLKVISKKYNKYSKSQEVIGEFLDKKSNKRQFIMKISDTTYSFRIK